MNLDELKALREKANHMFCEEYQFNSFDCIRIMGLIDSEIIQQTVTSKDVGKAICFLADMAESCAFMWRRDEHRSTDTSEPSTGEMHMLLAISALRQMRTEPCEWCNGTVKDISRGAISTLWIEGHHVGVECRHESNMASIRFCPNCGRKLV